MCVCVCARAGISARCCHRRRRRRKYIVTRNSWIFSRPRNYKRPRWLLRDNTRVKNASRRTDSVINAENAVRLEATRPMYHDASTWTPRTATRRKNRSRGYRSRVCVLLFDLFSRSRARREDACECNDETNARPSIARLRARARAAGKWFWKNQNAQRSPGE